MSLPVPVPGVDPGPDWANNISACFSIVDSHNHTPGQGNLIPPSGLDINTDLTFQSNNATDLRSARFTPQVTALSGVADVGCLYEAGVDLYFNDGIGNQIRITQSGSVAGASGTITGLPSGTASAAFSAATGTFIFQQATSTGANVDAATYVLRYPGSYPTPVGNFIALQAPAALASGFSITFPAALPGSTLPMLLSATGQISTGQITTAQITDANVTRPKLVAVGQQISSSCGSFTTNSTSPDPVTNLSVTITTTGRPVQLCLQPDGSGIATLSQQIVSNGFPSSTFSFYRDSTKLSEDNMEWAAGGAVVNYAMAIPVSSMRFLDTPAAGTYTYTFQVYNSSNNFITLVNNAVLVAYEL